MEKIFGNEGKTWQKPELIVLVRTRPEESVLAACKGGGGWTSSNNTAYDCKYGQYCSGVCSSLDIS
jgi:hypothetical protein